MAAGGVLDIRNLSKSYRAGFWLKRVAGLIDVILEVHEGETFGLLGPNGAGKTTLFKLLTGLVRPSSGTGLLMGHPLDSPRARMSIGYLPENPAVYDFLTGQQFMDAMGRMLGLDSTRLKSESARLLDMVGLTAKRDLSIRKYSKGMVQRLALAQSLINDPPVCILDEPMSGLDPLGRKLVRDVIGDLRSRGRTVIFSSHIVPDVEAQCDRVGLMLGGRLQDVGTVSGLVSGKSLSVEIVLEAATFTLPGPLADVTTMEPRGGQMFLSVKGDDGAADAVLAHVVASGTRVLSVQRHRETLEHFFVRRAKEIDPAAASAA